VVPDGAPRWQVRLEGIHSNPVESIEDRVQHLSDIDYPESAATFGRSDQGKDQRPFGIGQIA
jgi:hypothetical protein